MHLIIGSRIAEQLSMKDRTAFLLGNIAADAVPSKDVSHFFKGDARDYSREVDYKGFLDKYHAETENLYVLGYFTHLIADDIWLKGFYLPWIKNRMEADPQFSQLYYEDFRLLNGKLLEHYGFKEDLKKQLLETASIKELEGVKAEEVEKFIPYVLDDFNYDQDSLTAELKVFRFDQIIGYIETSAELGLTNLEAIVKRVET